MTGNAVAASPSFTEAARQVQHRLVIKRTLEILLHTRTLAAGVMLVLLILRALGGFVTPVIGVLLLLAWGAGCLGWALWKKADEYSALAFWDQAAARGDAFANAWWFEQKADDKRTRGQEFHLSAQRRLLPEALPNLAKDVTFPKPGWLPLLPLLFGGLMAIPVRQDTRLPDPKLTEEAQRVAREEGQKLADKKLEADKMQSLTAQEKAEVEKLQAKVEATAKALEQQKGQTAREVLGELERRAREAESLAEKLGAGDSAWASAEMVAEMRKHADTSTLGDAVSDKAPEMTSKEAQDLADKLKEPELATETRDRFAETLREIGKQAKPDDKGRTVGQHLIAADKDLAQTLPVEAAKEFQALADKMRTLAAREKAREQLEKLAQQLRESGSNVAGEGTKGMQQLAGSQNQKSPQSGQGAQGQQGMMNLANAPQMQGQGTQMQMPGLSNAPQGQGQQGQGMNGQSLQQMSPSSGKDGKSGDGKAMAITQGPSKPGQNKSDSPMLFAPIPGSDPNQPPDAVMFGQGPGSNPAGSDPGNATADLKGEATEKTKAAQTAAANAQRGTDGRSTSRTIEGQMHQEQASRGSQTTAIEAIAAEESALDDTALPPARREQVRRYFTELRKRFEKEP